jgi:hypothetical protein
LRGQLRSVHRGCVLLGAIEFARLQRTDRTVGGLGQIEDDGMRVELRCRIPVYRPRAVVFEQGGHEVPGRLRAAIAGEPRLHVRLQLVERDAHALTVRLTDARVAANQRRDRHAFRCRERRVPPGTMLHRRDRFSARASAS